MNGKDKEEKKIAHVTPVRIGDERVGKEKLWKYPSPDALIKKMSRARVDPKEDFIELITQNMKVQGFDSISSKIIGVLFIETKEISLEDIAKKTGYSLSAVSTAMKGLDSLHVIKRIKKPGSRKVFFYLDKNIISAGVQVLKTKYEKVMLPSKKALPEIIEEYKFFDDSEISKKELEIVENYYQQLIKMENVIKYF